MVEFIKTQETLPDTIINIKPDTEKLLKSWGFSIDLSEIFYTDKSKGKVVIWNRQEDVKLLEIVLSSDQSIAEFRKTLGNNKIVSLQYELKSGNIVDISDPLQDYR